MNAEKKLNQYNNSERCNFRYSVEETTSTKRVRYGTVEQNTDNGLILSDSHEKAANKMRGNVILSENSESLRSSVKDSAGAAHLLNADSVKLEGHLNNVRIGAHAAQKGEGGAANEAISISDNTAKNPLGVAFNVASREIEKAFGEGIPDEDLTERAQGQTVKYGLKATKHSIRGSVGLGKSFRRAAKSLKTTKESVVAGEITLNEAKKEIGKGIAGGVAGAGKSGLSLVTNGAIHFVEEFHGSDDLGVQVITKPKDAIVTGHRTIKTIKAAHRTLKKGAAVTRTVGTTMKKVFSNPIVLKGTLIAAVLLAGIVTMSVAISNISTMFSTFALKGDEWELSQTYLYITEKDARMEEDIVNEESRWHFPAIDEYRYILNGVPVSKENMTVLTDADHFISFLDSKYADFIFNDVKNEIDVIHANLHHLEKTRWTEEIERTSTYIDPDTGEEVEKKWIEKKYHMDIALSSIPLMDYLDSSGAITPDVKEIMETLDEVGIYSFRKELSSPFRGMDWYSHITSRWGWRLHPATGVLNNHFGLDIAMPGGTPINACSGGTAEVFHGTPSYGNYVKVVDQNGDYTLYAHMSATAVSSGQIIKPGEVVGYVGTTGDSTGNHLHVEYVRNGHRLNPMMFIENEIADGK